MTKKEQQIWIEWAGKVYGPFRSSQHAAESGFFLPAERTAEAEVRS